MMKSIILLLGIAILLIGCVSQQAAPLDEGAQPSSGSDVDDSFDEDHGMMEENETGGPMMEPGEGMMEENESGGPMVEPGEGRSPSVETTPIVINESEERSESTGMMDSGGMMDNGGMMGSDGILPSEISAHDIESDCWIVYDGEVYDVTSFLGRHPGGASAISPYCGLSDSSFAEAFEGQHGTSKVDVLESMGIHMGHLAGGMMGN